MPPPAPSSASSPTTTTATRIATAAVIITRATTAAITTRTTAASTIRIDRRDFAHRPGGPQASGPFSFGAAKAGVRDVRFRARVHLRLKVARVTGSRMIPTMRTRALAFFLGAVAAVSRRCRARRRSRRSPIPSARCQRPARLRHARPVDGQRRDRGDLRRRREERSRRALGLRPHVRASDVQGDAQPRPTSSSTG